MHLQTLPETPAAWRDDALAERWQKIRRVRRVVTGALEIERAAKRIGASLEAAPDRLRRGSGAARGARGLDFADICITSAITRRGRRGPGRGLPPRRGARRRRGAEPGRGPQMRPLLAGHARGGQRSGLPGRDAPRRPGPARVGRGASGGERGVMTRIAPRLRIRRADDLPPPLRGRVALASARAGRGERGFRKGRGLTRGDPVAPRSLSPLPRRLPVPRRGGRRDARGGPRP